MSTATAVMPRQNGAAQAADDPFSATATTGGTGNYDVCPAGNYPGVLVGLIDLGTHTEEMTDSKTKEKKVVDLRQIALVWELSGEIKSDGKPYVVADRYTNSFSDKAKLRAIVESWLGRKFAEGETFAYTSLLGSPCLVNIKAGKSAKGKDIASIGGISPMPRGMTAASPFNRPFAYAISSGEAPPAHDWLPYLYGTPIPMIVRQSKEWLARPKADDDDDIPF